MHQTRAEVSKKIPIPRKGTKYVVRARENLKNSVPVLIAVRDMLKLAHTAKEVNELIKQKLLKLNGREIKDYHRSIKLFSILEADKLYFLTFTPTKKFILHPTDKKEHLCKIIGKKILRKNKTQFNMHDGSNVISNLKIEIGDSVYLDFSGKIKKHIKMEKGAKCLIISGKYLGSEGKILEKNKRTCLVNVEGKMLNINKETVAVYE